MTTGTTTPQATGLSITESSLFSRINRHLEKGDQALRKMAFRDRGFNETGRFYIVNLHTNTIVAQHQDLENLGRELGVLKATERLQEEGGEA